MSSPTPTPTSKPEKNMYLLCHTAAKAWECLESNLYTLPSKQRQPLYQALLGVWKAVQLRCDNTVKQRCYSCSGADNDTTCNTEIQECGYEEQMCGTTLRVENGAIKFYKGCVQPDKCTTSCLGNGDCNYCCKGDLCNKQYDTVTEPEPATCQVDQAVKCGLEFASAYTATANIECSLSQSKMKCMEQYTETCQGEGLADIAASAYESVRILAQQSCTLTLTATNCGSADILAYSAALSDPRRTQSSDICTLRDNTIASLQALKTSKQCSNIDLLPTYQSLAMTEHLVKGFCSSGDPCATNTQTSVRAIVEVQQPCTGDFLDAATKTTQALFGLDNANTRDNICQSDVKQSVSTILKNCAVPDSLSELTSQLDSRLTTYCQAAQTKVCDVSVCNITAATDCTTTFTQNVQISANETCSELQTANECFERYTADCLSIQESSAVYEFNEATVTATQTCSDKVNVTVAVNQDTFTALSNCVDNLSNELSAAILADDIFAAMCTARQNALDCRQALVIPPLTESYLTSTLDNFNTLLGDFVDGSCSSANRPRRDAANTCDLQKVSQCLGSYIHSAALLPATPFDDRNPTCRHLDKQATCVTTNVASCAEARKSVILKLLNASQVSVRATCDPRVYEDDTCKESQVGVCMRSFVQLASNSLTPQKYICLATADAISCVEKFTSTCSDDLKTTIFNSVKEIVQSVVGTQCPNITLKLYCPGYDLTGVTAPCQLDKGRACVEALDLSTPTRAASNFCSALTQNITCVTTSAQGCTPEDLQVLKDGLSSVSTVVTQTPCGIQSATVNLENVCTAPATCSMTAALECMDVYAATRDGQCASAINVKNCIDGKTSGCTPLQKTFIDGLFSILFSGIATETCSPTFAPQAEDDSSSGISDCVSNFFLSLVSNSLCSSMTTFVDCVTSKTENNVSPYAQVFQQTLASLRDTLGASACKNDTATAVVVPTFAEGDDCYYREAIYCISKRSAFSILGGYVSQGEKKSHCSIKRQEIINTCVQDRTFKCSGDQKAFFRQSSVQSTSILQQVGMCSKPALCVRDIAYTCMDALTSQISAFKRDGDNQALCNQIESTRECVNQYTVKCIESERTPILTQFTALANQYQTTCQGVTQPPAPPPAVCPEIPTEDKRCNVFDAINCLFDFNSDILEQRSVIWRDVCTDLQRTVRCVAFNTSGCDSSDVDAINVNLDRLKNQVGRRCPWMTSDFCSDEKTCPVESSNCVSNLQDKLASQPTGDVCSFIDEARNCITEKISTCTAYQQQKARETLQKALAGMSLSVRCDSTSFDQDLIGLRYNALTVLTYSQGGAISQKKFEAACSSSTMRASTIINGDQTRLLPQLSNIITKTFTALNNSIMAVCMATDPPSLSCNAEIANNFFLDWFLRVSTSTKYNQDKFCSSWTFVKNEVTRALSSCSSSDNVSIRTIMQSISDDVNVLCMKDSPSCDERLSTATTCINDFNDQETDPAILCRNVASMRSCVTSNIAGCNGDNVTQVVQLFQSKVPKSCGTQFIMKLSHSPEKMLTVSEGGPKLELSFSLLSSLPADTQLRTRFSVSNDATTVPKCLRDGSESAISQLVIGKQMDTCGFTISSSNSGETVTVPIFARLDGTYDETQFGNLTITADVTQAGTVVESFTVVRYDVEIRNRDDKTAMVCSSINDPHIKTFNGLTYNNMLQGIFVLYQHRTMPYAVHATYQRCAEAGTCNCRVQVRIDDDVVDFNRCRPQSMAANYTAAPVDLSVDLNLNNGLPAGTQIWRDEDVRTYYVLLPSGTVVKVKAGDSYLNVWIMPSAADAGRTEGLCGLYDGDAYNDLRLPDGSRYMIQPEDRVENVLTPNNFSRAWRIVMGSDKDLSRGLPASDRTDTTMDYCICDSGATAVCSSTSILETCGVLRGSDITSDLVDSATQSTGSEKRRRKRQIDAANTPDISEDAELPIPTWPTSTGWTKDNATKFCQYQVQRSLLIQKCRQAADVIGVVRDYQEAVDNCVQDILYSGTTNFLSAAQDDAMESCITDILTDSAYQTNQTAKNIIMEILDLTCKPQDCNGNGVCKKGLCVCNDDYIGTSCEVKLGSVKTPTVRELVNEGHCDISQAASCRDVFIFGSDFLLSKYLTCHIEVMEIDSTGLRSKNVRTTVPAELVTSTQVKCRLVGVSGSKFAARISVSNDGQSPSQTLLFVAHDPLCHVCDMSSGRCDRLRTPVCEIGGHCFKPGQLSPTDKCFYCNPSADINSWTKNTSKPCLQFVDDTEGPMSLAMIAIIAVVCSVTAVVITVVLARVCLAKIKAKRNSQAPRDPEQNENMFLNPTYQSSGSQFSLARADKDNAPPDYSPPESFSQSVIRPRYN